MLFAEASEQQTGQIHVLVLEPFANSTIHVGITVLGAVELSSIQKGD